MEDLQKTSSTIELSTSKLEDALFNEIKELSTKINSFTQTVGNLHFTRLRLYNDIEQLEKNIEEVEAEHGATQTRLNEIGAEINKLYPGGMINIEDGTITYKTV